MKIISTVATSFALCALAACNQSPKEQAADNIEANAEMTADNLEEAADNATRSKEPAKAPAARYPMVDLVGNGASARHCIRLLRR